MDGGNQRDREGRGGRGDTVTHGDNDIDEVLLLAIRIVAHVRQEVCRGLDLDALGLDATARKFKGCPPLPSPISPLEAFYDRPSRSSLPHPRLTD